MKIKSAEFVTSIAQPEKYAEYSLNYSMPEICVVGRSNVGKSSFINCLAGHKKLAKTSSTPGRTRLINLFNFNDGEFMLVDLPGYGFAAAAKSEKQKWGGMIEGYLQTSEKLRHVFALVDIRHDPSEQDILMLKYLYHYRLPFTVIATKSDKLSKAQLGRSIQSIATKLAVGRDNIIAVSVETLLNKDKVLDLLDEVLAPLPASEIIDDEQEEK